jgi:ABC-type nitrate/sulfonate/bicarbonate transport system substrate-binding protein
MIRGTRAKIPSIFACAALLVVVLLGSGTSSAAFAKDTKSALTKVKVGYLPIVAELPLFAAAKHGRFRAAGLDVELVRFESSPAAQAALIAGDIDAVASIATASALAIEVRDPGSVAFFAVDAEDTSNCLSAIVTSRDSKIHKIADLRGHTVGVFPGPTAATYFSLVLKKNGLDPTTDVTIVQLETPLQLPALRSHQVDALATYEPTATQAVVQDHATRVARCPIERTVGAPWQAGSWVLSTSFIDDHPQAAKQFVNALYAGIDEVRAHPAAARRLLPTYTAIPEDVASAVPVLPITKAGEIDMRALRKQVRTLLKAGILTKELDVSKLVISGG